MANEDGVWRTVGGRRIFIKDGESLSSAMKKSGKFGKKKQDEEKELKEKYMNLSQEERVKAYEEGKNWKDLVKEKEFGVTSLSGEKEKDSHGRIVSEDEYERFRQAYREDKISKEDYKKDNYDALRNVEKQDIEDALEVRVEKAWQTDAFGTGKEDRFKLADGRYVAHDLEEDKWSINKVQEGKIQGKDYKNYDDMLSDFRREANSEERALEKAKWFKENEGKEFDRNSGAYKKAFEDYKKKHPNSKITLNKFIDMSEGK